jgi:LCP family protein required for cell wall assembly
MSEAPVGDGGTTGAVATTPADGTQLPPAAATRRRWPRVLLIGTLVLALLLAAAVVGGALLLRQLGGNVQTIPGLDTGPAAQSYEPLNVLIMGSDDRTDGNSTLEQAAQMPGERSDTTILVHIAADRGSALAVSIPRDTYLELPACASESGRYEVTAKFNTAFAYGGPACTVQTVEELTGVTINHAVVVDFKGFKNVVDALGGVEVCLARPVVDPDSGLDLPAGVQVVQGDQALAFVRARKNLGDGSDIDRISRQQQFLSSAIRAATSADLLTNPVKLYRVLDAATQSLAVDSSLDGLTEMARAAESLRGLQPADIRFVTMPFGYAPNGSDVLVNEAVAEEIWAAMRNDEPWPPAPEPGQTPLTAAPDSIFVQVDNGNGLDNAATAAAADLQGLGFVIAGLGLADASTYTASQVRHHPDDAEAARTLAAAVPGSTAVLDPAQPAGTLRLIVGADYRGAEPVNVPRVPAGSAADPAPSSAQDSACAQ